MYREETLHRHTLDLRIKGSVLFVQVSEEAAHTHTCIALVEEPELIANYK